MSDAGGFDRRLSSLPCDPAKLAELEAALGMPLPDHYRNFLLRCNGGTTFPEYVYIEGLKGFAGLD